SWGSERVRDGPQDVLVPHAILVTPDRHDGARAPAPGAPRRALAKQLDLPSCVHVSRPVKRLLDPAFIQTTCPVTSVHRASHWLGARATDIFCDTARPLPIPACLRFP